MANWKLERGATVGSIQHLLGSRTLVSSVFTPIRLRTWSVVVPLLIVMWACNPLGGQLSLRSVSKATNVTAINTPFFYIDPMSEFDLLALPGVSFSSLGRVIDITFSTALLTPASSKNGTQDVFGNIQIPMLEYLSLDRTADAEGWYHTIDNRTGVYAVIADAAEPTNQSTPAKPIYASLIGIPYISNIANVSLSDTTATSETSLDSRLQKIKDDLFGQNVINTRLEFSFETSYVYSNCSLQPLHVGEKVPYNPTTGLDDSNIPRTTFGNATDVATNGHGFSIKYDSRHNYNSTSERQLILESWLEIDDRTLGLSNATGEAYSTISEAQCAITTTYIEASISCASTNNCTVSKIRPSKKPHAPTHLTFLDGISYPQDLYTGANSDPDSVQQYHSYASNVARVFLNSFTNSSGIPDSANHLSPLESFFAHPDDPFSAAYAGAGAASGSDSASPLTSIASNPLFSHRLTQLLNTYWLSTIEPFWVLSGIDLDMIENGDVATPPSVHGTTFIEKTVLRCHVAYMAVLLFISVSLFVMGVGTAYLDATRKGPDVLDDFVNSLRHNPFVKTEKLGPSMQDGREMVQRLKGVVVKMGDVQPGEEVGFVAIATPGEGQLVGGLDHRRRYA